MEKQILPERDSGYISKEELETLLRKTFGIRDNYNVEVRARRNNAVRWFC